MAPRTTLIGRSTVSITLYLRNPDFSRQRNQEIGDRFYRNFQEDGAGLCPDVGPSACIGECLNGPIGAAADPSTHWSIAVPSNPESIDVYWSALMLKDTESTDNQLPDRFVGMPIFLGRPPAR
jgi:hypothetical protein